MKWDRINGHIISEAVLPQFVQTDLINNLRASDAKKGKIEGTTQIRLDAWPLTKFDTKIEIKLIPN